VQGSRGETEIGPVSDDRPIPRLALLFSIVLLVDQITKYIAVSTLQVGVPVPVVGDLVRWTLTYNPGGAFGVKLGGSTYYLITSFIIFFVLIYYVWRHRLINHIAVPLSIVAGGAAGNIIDRLRYGEVIDYIDCDFFNIHVGSYNMDRWPIFNVADMAVSTGIVITIILIFYYSHKAANADKVEIEHTEFHESHEI
jgi:signal peptidase II